MGRIKLTSLYKVYMFINKSQVLPCNCNPSINIMNKNTSMLVQGFVNARSSLKGSLSLRLRYEDYCNTNKDIAIIGFAFILIWQPAPGFDKTQIKLHSEL